MVEGANATSPDRSANVGYWLALGGVALAAVVVVLGAYTRLVDAGLGCPDWPGCYGQLGVPSGDAEVARAESAYPDAPVEPAKAWTEMVHRYAATALGLLILVVLGTALKNGQPWRLPALLAVLVIAQGAFGAWTVTLRLWPQVVTTHLLGGMATLALLWLLCLTQRRPAWLAVAVDGRLAALALAALIGQIALGGWLTSNYAALACPDFPMCHGEWWPPMDFAAGFDVTQRIGPNYLGGLMSGDARVAVHVAHRLGSVVVLVAVGALIWRLGNRPLAKALGIALAAQLGLGIANVLFALPLAVAVLHNAGAAVLLLLLVAANYAACRPSPEEEGS